GAVGGERGPNGVAAVRQESGTGAWSRSFDEFEWGTTSHGCGHVHEHTITGVGAVAGAAITGAARGRRAVHQGEPKAAAAGAGTHACGRENPSDTDLIAGTGQRNGAGFGREVSGPGSAGAPHRSDQMTRGNGDRRTSGIPCRLKVPVTVRVRAV